nr:hypothetical protein [Tanacetum cinerariifolium]
MARKLVMVLIVMRMRQFEIPPGYTPIEGSKMSGINKEDGTSNNYEKVNEDRASSVKVPVANFTLQSSVQLLRETTYSVRSNQWMRPTAPSVPLKLKVFAMLVACASRAAATLSSTSYWMAA